jgi:glycosyltransferase involved in cell wall biosynthesis
MSPTVGIVVPAFRPAVDTLGTYVQALDARLDPETIRIELDAPEAGVVDALQDLSADVHVSPERRGKGAAITSGFQALETDVLAFADADGSTPASSVADVVAPVVEGTADLGVGSRRHPDATVHSHQTFARRRLGDGFAWLARRLLDADLHDYQCGAKAITREAWTDVRGHLYEPGFAWDIELIAMAGVLDYRIAEVPVEWEDAPESTVSPIGTTVELGIALLSARHRAKLLRDDPLHSVIAATRDRPTALVDQPSDE